MTRLYSNENFPLPVVEKLRALGHDVLTIQEAGQTDQALPDQEVLAFATRENRALLTLNRLHFIRLHRQQPSHAGIVVCTFDPDFSGQGERIHQAIIDGEIMSDSNQVGGLKPFPNGCISKLLVISPPVEVQSVHTLVRVGEGKSMNASNPWAAPPKLCGKRKAKTFCGFRPPGGGCREPVAAGSRQEVSGKSRASHGLKRPTENSRTCF